MTPDARFEDTLLVDAFDFSRYPTFKTKNPKRSTVSGDLRYRLRERTLFPCRGSPPFRAIRTYHRSRNVSEPQFVFSTNYMSGSWFTDFASTRTISDIPSFARYRETCATTDSCQSIATIRDTGDKGGAVNTPCTADKDSRDVFGPVEASDYKSEESLYSMDSADQDAHPVLLSMPIIPQIKLERKATVRQPDPTPPLDAAQNRTFLSPRIPDLRTPARMSSRRYGRILAGTNEQALATKGHHTSRRFGSTSWGSRDDFASKLKYKRSVSEPLLGSLNMDEEREPLLKKETDDSPHSDLLLSLIDDVEGSPALDVSTDETLKQEEEPTKYNKGGHRRSSVGHPVFFSNIVNAVVDGCASLDIRLRKPKEKPKAVSKVKPVPNPHDPTSKWAPKDGHIIIKVFVPSTDDIWMFRVPQDTGLVDFTTMVVSKLGFVVSLSGSVWDEPRYYFKTDKQFRSWVKTRIRFGRNLPIVAHALAPLPLVKLSVDTDGCEVWCYA